MAVVNPLLSQPIDIQRLTAIQTAWHTLNRRQQEQVLHTVVMVCCQMAGTRQTSPQRLTQPDPIPSNEEVGDE